MIPHRIYCRLQLGRRYECGGGIQEGRHGRPRSHRLKYEPILYTIVCVTLTKYSW